MVVFTNDILSILEEWRLTIIICSVLLVAWFLWYSDSDSQSSNAGNKSLSTQNNGWDDGDDNCSATNDEELLTPEEREVKTKQQEAINKAAAQPLSLAEEIVAIHNIRMEQNA
jgi:hypothetical protein